MTRIKNVSLAGEQLITQYGTYTFDSKGIAEVPDELAQKLSAISGFTILGKVDDTVPSGDTTPGGDVTLDGGVVWHKIDGGYIVTSNVITFTVTGSGVDSDVIPPANVTLQNDVLLFDENTDVANVHVKGVNVGDTLLIGDDTYRWWNTDGNLDNGYELEIVQPDEPEPAQPLPGGGSYIPVDGGFAITDGGATYTIPGDTLDTDHISIQNGKLVISEGADLDNLVVIGVAEGDTLLVGDYPYEWVPVGESPEEGMKLEFSPNIEPLVNGGSYYTVKGGYVAFDSDTTFVFVGDTLDTDHIGVRNGQIVLQEGVDTTTIHVSGVEEHSTVQVGDSIYRWENTDNIVDNGYELVLVSKQGWKVVDGSYIYDKDGAAYTVSGSAVASSSIIPSNITITSGAINLSSSIDVNNIHILGVTAEDTIQIGDNIYKWVDSDSTAPGYELEYVPQYTDLPGGGSYTAVEGGFEVTDGTKTFTIFGDTLDTDHISIQNGQLTLSPGIDVNSVHILGVTEFDTIQIGDDTYKWVDSDGTLNTGYELEYIQKPIQLSNGGSYTTVEGGFALTDGSETFIVAGSTLDTDHIGVQNGQLILLPGVDMGSLHVLGVTANDTVQIDDSIYKWSDVDSNPDNGYELVLVSKQGWKVVDGSYIYDKDGAAYTVSGSAVASSSIIPSNITITSGAINLSSSIDVNNIHILGVALGDTVLVGNDTYKWVDLDNTPENGYELEYVIQYTDLPGGGSYTAVEGGFVVTDGTVEFTVLGDTLDTDHISIQNGKLVVSSGINLNDLVVIGVTENDTLQVGDYPYKWVPAGESPEEGMKLEFSPNIETLPGGGGYYTIVGGFVVFDEESTFILRGKSFDTDNIGVGDGKIIIHEGTDISNLHVSGVEEHSTVQVGNSIYRWENTDNNEDNGYELVLVSKNGWSTVPGGYAYDRSGYTYTVSGSAFNSDNVVPNNINISGGIISLSPSIDVDNVHVLGVTANDTLLVGSEVYRWVDLNNTLADGYELKLVPATNWVVYNDTVIYNDGEVTYTITGPGIGFDIDQNVPTGVTVEGGKLEFDPALDLLNIHVKGVEENSVIQIGEDYYKWTNADGNINNGLELTLLEVPEGFEYDFDGKKFTIEGGMDSGITVEQLNTGVYFDDTGKLIIGRDIVSSVNTVHFQGLESGSTINVAGDDYTVMDTDNDLSNGYELVGGTDDAFDWKWANRNRPAEPQTWRHYTDGVADIKVQGVSSRPVYNQRSNTVTVLGDEITSVTNSTASDLKIAGDVIGNLSPGSLFNHKNGLISALEGSYAYVADTLYVPNGTITGMSGEVMFLLKDKKLTIITGNIDVDAAVVSGNAITSVTIDNKNFLVKGNKLQRDAFTKRRVV